MPKTTTTEGWWARWKTATAEGGPMPKTTTTEGWWARWKTATAEGGPRAKNTPTAAGIGLGTTKNRNLRWNGGVWGKHF